jgi:AcrR family transcriptional regulator
MMTGKGSCVNAWPQALSSCILGKLLHLLGMNSPPQKRPSVARPDNRLSERSWIEAAFEHVIKSNFSDLSVEALARELDVTKGSFYWHFRDRRHLLERVLEHWTETATIRVTQWSASESADGIERLVRLLSLPANTPPDRRGAEVELAVRSWARRDETAAKTVAKVDSMRFSHFVEIIAGLGFSDREARRRASIAQAFMLGDAFLRSGLTPAERTENARVCAEMVARRSHNGQGTYCPNTQIVN